MSSQASRRRIHGLWSPPGIAQPHQHPQQSKDITSDHVWPSIQYRMCLSSVLPTSLKPEADVGISNTDGSSRDFSDGPLPDMHRTTLAPALFASHLLKIPQRCEWLAEFRYVAYAMLPESPLAHVERERPNRMEETQSSPIRHLAALHDLTESPSPSTSLVGSRRQHLHSFHASIIRSCPKIGSGELDMDPADLMAYQRT